MLNKQTQGESIHLEISYKVIVVMYSSSSSSRNRNSDDVLGDVLTSVLEELPHILKNLILLSIN